MHVSVSHLLTVCWTTDEAWPFERWKMLSWSQICEVSLHGSLQPSHPNASNPQINSKDKSKVVQFSNTRKRLQERDPMRRVLMKLEKFSSFLNADHKPFPLSSLGSNIGVVLHNLIILCHSRRRVASACSSLSLSLSLSVTAQRKGCVCMCVCECVCVLERSDCLWAETVL